MFHICEFFFPNTASKEYGGLTDAKVLDLFTAKTKKGGHILFYTRSMGWEKTKPILAEVGEEGGREARRRAQDAAGLQEEVRSQCPGRGAAPLGAALQTRDRYEYRMWNGPGSAVQRYASTTAAVDA